MKKDISSSLIDEAYEMKYFHIILKMQAEQKGNNLRELEHKISFKQSADQSSIKGLQIWGRVVNKHSTIAALFVFLQCIYLFRDTMDWNWPLLSDIHREISIQGFGTFEFFLNDSLWIHWIQWIVTKSKSGIVTRDALCLAIDILPD